jgi:hypothetical protein
LHVLLAPIEGRAGAEFRFGHWLSECGVHPSATRCPSDETSLDARCRATKRRFVSSSTRTRLLTARHAGYAPWPATAVSVRALLICRLGRRLLAPLERFRTRRPPRQRTVQLMCHKEVASSHPAFCGRTAPQTSARASRRVARLRRSLRPAVAFCSRLACNVRTGVVGLCAKRVGSDECTCGERSACSRRAQVDGGSRAAPQRPQQRGGGNVAGSRRP